MEVVKNDRPHSVAGQMSGKIFQAIPAIMGELEAVGRDRVNEQQRFRYRGIDDLYNALQPLLAKHRVFTVPTVEESKRTERPTKSGGVQFHVELRIRYRFFAEDGSYFDAVLMGEGMDAGDKAVNKAESVAHKYALTQVFAVRTEDENQSDACGQTPERTVQQRARQPQQPRNDQKTTTNQPPKSQEPPKPEVNPAYEAVFKRVCDAFKDTGWGKDKCRAFVCASHPGCDDIRKLSKLDLETVELRLREYVAKNPPAPKPAIGTPEDLAAAAAEAAAMDPNAGRP